MTAVTCTLSQTNSMVDKLIYFEGNPGNTSFEPTHSYENGGAIYFDGGEDIF